MSSIETRKKMADFKPRNILIIGATGNIGRFITQSIVAARSEFDRVAILTSAPGAGSEKEKFINEELRPKNVEIIVGDISNEQDVLNAYKGTIPFFPPLIGWALDLTVKKESTQ